MAVTVPRVRCKLCTVRRLQCLAAEDGLCAQSGSASEGDCLGSAHRVSHAPALGVMVGSLSSEVSSSLRVALLGVLICSACTEPVKRTQVTVVIDADDTVRDKIRSVEVEVRSGLENEDVWEAEPTKQLIPRNGSKSWPLSFSLRSPERRGRVGYQVTATAKGADDGKLAVVRALSYYVQGKSLVLPLRFDDACAARTELCPMTFTCVNGECIPAFVPEGQLPTEKTAVSEMSSKGEPAAGSDAPEPQGGRSGAMTQAGGGATPTAAGCSGASCGSCPARDAKGACLPCPAGFFGDDPKHCSPGLISLELSNGKLAPAFDPEKSGYTASVPFLSNEVTLRYALPAATELLINGRAATSPTEWKTGPLEIGGTAEVMLTLTAKGAESRTYTLAIERTLKQESLVTSPFPSAGDSFGSRVAISGDLMIVGAPYEDGSMQTPSGAPDESTKDSGAAYVFERTAGGWMHRAYLKSESPRENARMGFFVAIDGKRFAVGAPYDAKGGSVSVYEWRDGAAQIVSVLHADSDNAQFGRALALQGDRLAIRAAADSLGGAQEAGGVYVFEFAGGTWQCRAFLKSGLRHRTIGSGRASRWTATSSWAVRPVARCPVRRCGAAPRTSSNARRTAGGRFKCCTPRRSISARFR